MPQFEFHFEDEAPAPSRAISKPQPTSKSTAHTTPPAPGFGLDTDYEPLPYVEPVWTPAQEQYRQAERAWTVAHEQMCGYTRYGTIPADVASHVEQLFQQARALAY